MHAKAQLPLFERRYYSGQDTYRCHSHALNASSGWQGGIPARRLHGIVGQDAALSTFYGFV
jgi:hypothetical protein